MLFCVVVYCAALNNIAVLCCVVLYWTALYVLWYNGKFMVYVIRVVIVRANR